MRKEVVWAGIIGITFGLVVAFGVWRINSSLKPKNGIKATPTPPAVSEFKITLNKPENNDVVTQDSTRVSGITKPLIWVTISAENGDYIIQSDEQGVFQEDVELNSGVNQIKLTAFDPNGNQSLEKVLIVYSSAFQEKTILPSSGEATTTDSAIRQKVEEKVSELLNRPKAYIGTVTDISDLTIQIKTKDSEIKQVSTEVTDVAVIKVGTVNKTVKLTDIGIGDFIVAMGYINSNSVLSAQRILITSPIEERKETTVFAKVTDTSTKDITVTTLKGNKEDTLTPGKNTDIEMYTGGKTVKGKFANIDVDDLVIYVVDQSESTPSIRALFDLTNP